MAKTHRLIAADALLKAYSANGRINQYLVQHLSREAMIGMWEFSKRAKE